MIRILLFIVLVALQFGCKKGTPLLVNKMDAQASLLIKNVNIFNGIDSSLISNQNVFLSNGVIQTITSEEITAEQSTSVIDGTNKTLMPGLIDAHVHLSGSGAVPWANQKADIEYNLSAYLYSGITTVYDLGGLSHSLEKLTEKINKNEIIGPDVYHTHIPITVKNSHPIPLTEIMLPWPLKSMVNTISPTIENPADAENIIENYLKNSVDYVKIIVDQIPPGSPEMNYGQLKALIQAAHQKNKKVFVHIGSPKNAIAAVKAKADVLAHGVWRGKLTKAQADTIAKAKVPVIYTMAGFVNVGHIHNGDYSPNKLDKKLVPNNILESVTGSNGKQVAHQPVMNEFFNCVNQNSKDWAHNLKLLKQRGVSILVGTDSNLPGTYAGATYLQELNLLKKHGLSNFRILNAATYENARIFLEEPNFGSIKQGFKANVLLLNGNPLQNLNVLNSPELIVHNGNIVNRK